MRTINRFTFWLTVRPAGGTERTVELHPLYSGLGVVWTRDGENAYHTPSMNGGKLTLVGDDFWTVYQESVRTKFTLVVKEMGEERMRGYFRKTDCETDVDHQTVTVEATMRDVYKGLNEGGDNEYNLVRMGLMKRALSMRVYPQRQTYFLGDTKLYLWSTGKQAATANVGAEDSHWKLVAGMHFGGTTAKSTAAPDPERQGMVGMVRYNGDNYYSSATAMKTYGSIDPIDTCYWGEQWLWQDGVENSSMAFRLYGKCYLGTGLWAFCLQWYNNGVLVGQTSYDDFAADTPQWRTWGVGMDKLSLSTKAIFYHNSTQKGVAECRFNIPYTRFVSRDGEIADDWLMPDDDITRGYTTFWRYGLPELYPSNRRFAFSTRTVDEGDGLIQVEGTDKFYAPPDDSGEWVPVREASWFQGVSFWAGNNRVEEINLRDYDTTETCNDFYKLGDVIKAVVKKLDSSIVFEADEEHSRFLFGDENPVTGEAQGVLYVTQKSNLLNLGYDYPAWLAPVTWNKIVTLLKNGMNLRWDIYEDASGRHHLRIEHAIFYMNGNSYGTDGRTVLDLTGQDYTATRVETGYRTNRWAYDKGTLADRYEYGWMDRQSADFDGAAVETADGYGLFTSHTTEDRKVDWFDTDIDFVMMMPQEISSDGFALVMADEENSRVWSTRVNEEGYLYLRQNWPLSHKYMQPRYCVAGMYAERVKIGETEYANVWRARMRTAEVRFNVGDGVMPRPEMLIRTDAGVGEVDSLGVDMSSETWTATVRYETEE